MNGGEWELLKVGSKTAMGGAKGCGQTLLGSIRTPMRKTEVGGFPLAQVPRV